MAPRDPAEVGIGGPDFALVVFEDEKAYRPIQTRIGLGGDELGPERRVAEDQQHRGLQLDARIGGELRLVDLVEELDALVGDISLQALDRLADRISALDRDDAVIAR